jgi:hypothetical protein
VRKILAFTVIVEIATGLALLLIPALVGALLVGGDLAGAGVVVARCLGIVLIALGLACWRGRQSTGNVAEAVRGMLLYNAAVALYLAYVGTVGHLGGPLLWPAILIHAVVAALLAITWRRERGTAEIGS